MPASAAIELFECPHAPEACRPLRITAEGCLKRQAVARKGGLLRETHRTTVLDTAARLECDTGRQVKRGEWPAPKPDHLIEPDEKVVSPAGGQDTPFPAVPAEAPAPGPGGRSVMETILELAAREGSTAEDMARILAATMRAHHIEELLGA
jgi:hypothetical protein